MSRPDHLLVVDVERSTVTVCTQSQRPGPGYEKERIRPVRHKAVEEQRQAPLLRVVTGGLFRNGLIRFSTCADTTAVDVSGDDPGLAGLLPARWWRADIFVYRLRSDSARC